MSERTTGFLATISCFLLWGALPIYWKLLEGVGAYEILAHRIIWSFFVMIPVLIVLRKIDLFKSTVRELIHNKKKGLLQIASCLLICANWCIFIWAVTNDHIVDSSFGYYINPLMSVFLGVLIFHERLSRLKWFAIAIAACGILWMSFRLGHMPYISLGVALTFSLYGAAKKGLHISPFVSITLEAFLVLPIFLGYVIYLGETGTGHFLIGNTVYTVCLIGAGVVSALPLVLFSVGANHLPLNVLGFCQYISPTISLLIGIFLYNEPFNATQMTGFGVIWLSIIIFTISDIREQIHNEEMAKLAKKNA